MSSITRVVIESIPHEEQRYPTCGDWFFDENGTLQIKVSQMAPHFEMLVAIHELVEAFLCTMDGVTPEQVDVFDMKYEAERQPGDESEPGDNMNAPYYRQHQLGTAVERMLVSHLGISWQLYEKTINDLFKEQ